MALGVNPYHNHPTGVDPLTEDDLNEWALTTGDVTGTVGENHLNTGASPQNLFQDADQGDYHLEPFLQGGAPNPAIDGLLFGWSIADEIFGGVRDDIDGETRPGSGDRYDLGADEL